MSSNNTQDTVAAILEAAGKAGLKGDADLVAFTLGFGNMQILMNGGGGASKQPEGKPELSYFDGPGRANVTRLSFVVGGVKFVDHRVADWPAVKGDASSTPAQLFGSLPVIKHGELLIAESVATAMYAADLAGLVGSSAADRALCSMVVSTNEDLRQVMYKGLFGSDESKAAGLKDLPNASAKFLAGLERALERKTSDGPFFLGGDSPSVADLAVFDNVHSAFPGLLKLGVNLDAYPKVVACADAVAALPTVKAFVAAGFKPPAPGVPVLSYFDGPGRANLTRLAFLLGGTEFSDHRVADWPAVKGDPTSAPAQCFGSMPVIQHGDLLIAASAATAAYAADLGGLHGSCAADRGVCAMVVAANESLKQVMYKGLFGSDESKAAGLKDLPEASAKVLAGLERALERKGSDGPFFLGGDSPSVADLAVFDNVHSPFPGLLKLGVNLDAFPKVVACADAVAAIPAVKAFMEAGFKKP